MVPFTILAFPIRVSVCCIGDSVSGVLSSVVSLLVLELSLFEVGILFVHERKQILHKKEQINKTFFIQQPPKIKKRVTILYNRTKN